ESQTRVDDDVRRVHAHGDGLVDAGAQLGDHLGDDVIVVEGCRGLVEIAAPVHEHDGGGRIRGETEHGGIRLPGGNVVDDVGTGGQGLPCDSGAHRVDADHRAGGGELTNDGHDTAQLFVLIDADGPRPRRLASDIDDVGAGVD